MAAIGLLADSDGDLEAFDAAYEALKALGAKRFIFPGGRYSDVDEWVARRKERARGGRGYSDVDFLADVSAFLLAEDQVERPPAFGEGAEVEGALQELARLDSRFLRTPERGAPEYQDPAIAKKAVELIGDTLCCVVHDRNELVKDDLVNALVFIHGNEPEPKVVKIGPRYFVTPGRLSGATQRTCAVLTTAEKGLQFKAITLEGKELVSELLVIGGKTKVSVK